MQLIVDFSTYLVVTQKTLTSNSDDQNSKVTIISNY